MPMTASIHENKQLRNAYHVFRDRLDAGRVLGEMLEPAYKKARHSIILAIPAGGVPIGLEISGRLKLPLDFILVRKIQVPGNAEAGFGALTLDGSTFLNEELMAYLKITPTQMEQQISLAQRDLEERNALFRGGRPFPNLIDSTVILADDGLASGYTMLASIHAVKARGARTVIVAVPTAPEKSIRRVAPLVDAIYCANIRDTTHFAVADAYKFWYDLSREDVLALISCK